MEKYQIDRNNYFSVDFEKKTIPEIVIDNKNIICGNIPFFAVKLRYHNDEKKIVTAFDFAYLGLMNGEHVYDNDLLKAVLTVKLVGEQLVWGIRVTNKTDWLIEQVELMSFGVNRKLKEEGGLGEVVIPYNEGGLISDMRKRENTAFCYRDVDYPSYGVSFVFPNMISSQFMAYSLDEGGLFMGMLDPERTPKHIDFKYEGECIKYQMRVFANVNYGEDYEMDFPSVLQIYHGNFYDACEIYRQWFKNNLPGGLKTIEERYDSLPKWYHEAPVIVTYPVCGVSDRDTEMKPGGLYPYTNGLEVADYFSKATDSPVMIILMQWESTAPWAPPYVWPPYGDVNDFSEFVKGLHERGDYLGVYCSGFGWTNKSYRRDYNKEKEFNEGHLADIMCSSSGGYIESTVVSEIRKGYDMCPSQEKSKELIVNETNKIIDAGVDYVQVLDQNHGGCSYFCYSEKHGHVPAPGKWQVTETNDLLSRINLRQALIGCESAASEPFIGNLAFSDNRMVLNQTIGQSIPMYAYIYHEYVNNFMGNGICNLIQNHEYSMPYRLAYSFLCGDALAFVIDGDRHLHTSWCVPDLLDDRIPLNFAKTLMSYRNSPAYGKFLHMGKMVKPSSFKTNVLHFDEMYGYQFDFPAVLSAAYEYMGVTYEFFVNYSLSRQTVKFNRPVRGCLDVGTDEYQDIESIETEPLSVTVIKK